VLTWNGVVNDQHILFLEINKKIKRGLWYMCYHATQIAI
jgi:hypothetical protein